MRVLQHLVPLVLVERRQVPRPGRADAGETGGGGGGTDGRRTEGLGACLLDDKLSHREQPANVNLLFVEMNGWLS